MSIDRIGMMLLQKQILRVDDVGDISAQAQNLMFSTCRRDGGVGLHIRALGSF